MSGRVPLLLFLGAAACVRPNPLFDEDEDDDADDVPATASSDGSSGGDDSSGGDTDSGAGVGDTCGDTCSDPDRDCLDGDACVGDLEWVWRTGDEYAQLAGDVAVLSDGDLVIVGSFAGSLGEGDLLIYAGSDPLESDAFVARLDPSGQIVWLHAFDGPGRQALTAVAALPGDLIAVGGRFDGMFDTGPLTLEGLGAAPGLVGALTGDGEWIFVEGIAGAAIDVVDVAAGPGGAVDVAGNFTGSLTLGDVLDSPDPDLFAARFDQTGALVWSHAVVAPGEQRAHAIAPAAGGGLVLAGAFTGTLAIAGQQLAAQATDGLLLTLGADGQPTAVRALGGPDVDSVDAIAVAPDGALVIAGTHGVDFELGGTDLAGPSGFLAALDPSGAARWSRTGLPVAGAPQVRLDLDGRAVALLPIADAPIDLGAGPLGGSPGALLVKLTASGTLAWHHHVAADVGQFSAALATGPGDAIAVTGGFAPTLALAGQSLQSAGERDVFTARFRP